ATLEQATAAVRMVTAQGGRPVGVLTGERRSARVAQAHGRDCSRGQGGGERQLPAAVVGGKAQPAIDRGQPVLQTTRRGKREHQEGRKKADGRATNRDQEIAAWLKWLRENGSVPGRY